MPFSSFEFVLFFVVVVGPFFALPPRWRKPWLLGWSAVFYMAWLPLAILLILFSATIDDFVARKLDPGGTAARRKWWLALSLVTNFGALFVFKYYDFFVGSWASLARLAGAGFDPPLLHVVLPVGISFYTFEAVRYTVGVYRGKYPAERSYARLLLFILYFPQAHRGAHRARRPGCPSKIRDTQALGASKAPSTGNLRDRRAPASPRPAAVRAAAPGVRRHHAARHHPRPAIPAA